jgi:hypothetical protein
MNILVFDVGGTQVKLQDPSRKERCGNDRVERAFRHPAVATVAWPRGGWNASLTRRIATRQP